MQWLIEKKRALLLIMCIVETDATNAIQILMTNIEKDPPGHIFVTSTSMISTYRYNMI